MGTLDDRLLTELKDAMRAGDTTRRDVIRFLRAAMKNAQIARVRVPDDLPVTADEHGVPIEGAEDTFARSADRDRPLDDAEGLAVVQRQIKQRQDAIELFERGGRADLVERERAQLAVLQGYLPTGLGAEEIDALVREVIAATGASGPRDMKTVMPALLERAAGRADSRALSEAARRLLAGG